MTTDNEKVYAGVILEAVQKNDEQMVSIDESGKLCLKVKHTLQIADAMALVGSVVSACVDSDSMEYTPEGYSTIVRREVLARYANVEMPDDVEDVYKLVWGTDVYDRVYELINQKQLDDLLESANKRIAYERSMLISTAGKKVAEVIDQMDRMMKVVQSAFSGLDTGEMNSLMKNLSSMEQIDAAGIVKAVGEKHKSDKKTVRKSKPAKAAETSK